jgi:hypothetical protein
MVSAGKTDHLVIAVVSIDTFSELVCGDKIHQLGKDRFPGIHTWSPHSLMRKTGTSGKNFKPINGTLCQIPLHEPIAKLKIRL